MFTESVDLLLAFRLRSDRAYQVPGRVRIFIQSKNVNIFFMSRENRAFNAWGSSVSYETCREFTGPK
jgi:hypothetical protein